MTTPPGISKRSADLYAVLRTVQSLERSLGFPPSIVDVAAVLGWQRLRTYRALRRLAELRALDRLIDDRDRYRLPRIRVAAGPDPNATASALDHADAVGPALDRGFPRVRPVSGDV